MFENPARVARAACRFWVELDASKGFRFMAKAFIGLIVRVAEPWFPAFGKRGLIDHIAVILTRNIAESCADLINRLIVASMAILHAERLGPSRQGEDLMAQTNP